MQHMLSAFVSTLGISNSAYVLLCTVVHYKEMDMLPSIMMYVYRYRILRKKLCLKEKMMTVS